MNYDAAEEDTTDRSSSCYLERLEECRAYLPCTMLSLRKGQSWRKQRRDTQSVRSSDTVLTLQENDAELAPPPLFKDGTTNKKKLDPTDETPFIITTPTVEEPPSDLSRICTLRYMKNNGLASCKNACDGTACCFQQSYSYDDKSDDDDDDGDENTFLNDQSNETIHLSESSSSCANTHPEICQLYSPCSILYGKDDENDGRNRNRLDSGGGDDNDDSPVTPTVATEPTMVPQPTTTPSPTYQPHPTTSPTTDAPTVQIPPKNLSLICSFQRIVLFGVYPCSNACAGTECCFWTQNIENEIVSNDRSEMTNGSNDETTTIPGTYSICDEEFDVLLCQLYEPCRILNQFPP